LVPSLTKLQSLDANYESLYERICAAAEIAGVSLENEDLALDKSFSYARAEWVLRWITDKLKPNGKTDGKAFRASDTAWTLLSQLVDFLPANSIATVMANANILTSVEASLNEWMSDSRLQDWGLPQTTSENGNEHLMEVTSRNIRKRKRDRDNVLAKTVDLVPFHVELQALRRRHNTICDFLRRLLKKAHSEGDESSSTGAERIKTLLKLEAQAAATFLGAETTATIRLVQLGQALDTNYIDCYIQVWRSRSLEQNDELGASATIFSNEALIPILLLHGHLQNMLLNETNNKTAAIIMEKLERLLHEHILLPARLQFSESSRQRVDTEQGQTYNLSTLLTPFRESISFLRDNEDSRELDAMVVVVPKIYDLAIRHSRRSTPKQRTHESPWLELVLKELLACCHGELSTEPKKKPKRPVAAQKTPSTPLLEEMLASTIKYKLTLSQPFILQLMIDYSGLTAPPTPDCSSLLAIRWSLVKLILELDGDLFLNPTANTKSKARKNDEVDFGSYLISHITNTMWTSESVSRKTTLSDAVFESFVSDIVVGLLHAYTRSKEVLGFLKIWFSQLANAASNLSPDALQASAWTNPTLISQAGAALQESTSAPQIEETLNQTLIPAIQRMMEHFGLANQTSLDSTNDIEMAETGDPIGDLYASIVIIEAVLLGISREDVVSHLKDSIDTIWILLQRITLADLPQFLLSGRIWGIMTRIRQLQREMHPSAEDFVDAGKYFLEPGILDIGEKTVKSCAQNESWPNTDSQSYAYLFLITSCDEMMHDAAIGSKAHDIIKDSTEAYFSRCSIVQDDNYPVLQSHASTALRSMRFDLTVISAYPYVLRYVSNLSQSIVFILTSVAASSMKKQETKCSITFCSPKLPSLPLRWEM